MDGITAMARKTGGYDPMALPDTFTVYNYANEDIRAFLHPHWHNFKAIHPMWYFFLGMLYFCIGTTAVCGNFIVLKIFSSFPALRTPANMLVMNLAFSDFCLMLALFPEMVYNFFMGGSWQFGETACQIHAFLGSVFGYSQIFTLTVISWDRYNVIVKGFSGAPLTFSKVSMILIINYIWSIGWAVAPLVGFGGYGLDGILGTCSYDYVTQTFTNQISILLLCITNYLVPLVIILWAYYGIVQAVFKHEDELRQQAKKMNVASLRSNADQQSASAEIRIAKVAIINVTLWTLAWTPFTVICMLGTWGDVSKITPLVSSIPVIIAKTSCCYNPVIYAISHPKYRECLKEAFPGMCIVVKKEEQAPARDNASEATQDQSA